MEQQHPIILVLVEVLVEVVVVLMHPVLEVTVVMVVQATFTSFTNYIKVRMVLIFCSALVGVTK
jgi:hypothetical protein